MWEIKTTSGLRRESHNYTWFDEDQSVNGGQAGAIGSTASCDSTLQTCNTTAYQDAINLLIGSARLCGADDWRLPRADELSGLADAGTDSAPPIDTTWFPNTRNTVHWTGESYAPSNDEAWTVSFFVPGVVRGAKGAEWPVRLVRGGK